MGKDAVNKADNNKETLLHYKGKPLVRCGKTLYYGSMSDPYVAMLTVAKQEHKFEMDMADKVVVQIISTDLDVDPKKLVIKRTEKKGLYEAINIADIWLKRQIEH